MSVNILVVDDETDVTDLFQQQFRREVRQGQCTMRIARSAEAALCVLGEGVVPESLVILSDINMPGMDGLSLPSVVRERQAGLPVIMVSAYGDDERREHAEEKAGRGVVRPVDVRPPSLARFALAEFFLELCDACAELFQFGELFRWSVIVHRLSSPASWWWRARRPRRSRLPPSRAASCRCRNVTGVSHSV